MDAGARRVRWIGLDVGVVALGYLYSSIERVCALQLIALLVLVGIVDDVAEGGGESAVVLYF